VRTRQRSITTIEEKKKYSYNTTLGFKRFKRSYYVCRRWNNI